MRKETLGEKTNLQRFRKETESWIEMVKKLKNKMIKKVFQVDR